jgi:hypothetical protein
MIGDHKETKTFGIMNLSKSKVFLGYEWLKQHNPNMDWQNSILLFDRCPTDCLITPEKFTNLEQDEPEITVNKIDIEEEDCLFFIDMTEFMVNRITGPAMELAIE